VRNPERTDLRSGGSSPPAGTERATLDAWPLRTTEEAGTPWWYSKYEATACSRSPAFLRRASCRHPKGAMTAWLRERPAQVYERLRHGTMAGSGFSKDPLAPGAKTDFPVLGGQGGFVWDRFDGWSASLTMGLQNEGTD
jgi:hypothetical protein